MGKMDEKILVVDRRYLFEHEATAFQGIETNENRVKRLMSRLKAFYEIKRGYAENDERMKQPIPYAVIVRGDEVFLYERLNKGGEARLHGQLSIGVGGHMNLLDDNCQWRDNLYRNLNKELNEELHIDLGAAQPPRIIGILNDDSDEVGRVHVGIIAVIEMAPDAEVTVKETDKLEGYWVRLRDLTKPPLYDGLENWSQMLADILENVLYTK